MLASQQPTHQVQHLVVTPSHAGQRVDNFLLSMLCGVPKSRIYRIIRKGEVRVNKGRIDVSYKLVCGDTVRIPPVRFTPKSEKKPLPPHGKLAKLIENSILYQDDQLLIIDKPAGLAVHGGSGVSLGLIEVLRAMYPEAPFLELVHRLDRDTSGCIMIAKERSMLTHLHACLKAGKIQKTYFAIVQGKWRGTKLVEAPLLKYLLRSGERMVKVDPEGKHAQTQIQVVESYEQATLIQAKPITGRTHQIRVHCAFMGHPIIGDPKYGDMKANQQAKEQGFERLFLHAHQLSIRLPYKPYNLTITSSMPKAFENYLLALKIDK